MDTFEMIAAERRDLADVLDTLDADQWATPSLCGSWTVRDVAAHLTTPMVVPGPTFLLAFVKSGFNFDRANDRVSRDEAKTPTTVIVENLRANAEHRFTPPTMGPEAPLTDVLVHGQDIRRPLGLTRTTPVDRFTVALDFVGGAPRGFVPGRRIDGLHLQATDIDWSGGAPTGAAVRGPAEALLLAVTGRPVALDDLDGDGVEILRGRLG